MRNVEYKRVTKKVEPHIYMITLYDKKDDRYVSTHYEISYSQKSGLNTSRLFDTLEEAREFNNHISRLKNKVRADQSLTSDFRNYEFKNDEYPDNLLAAIGVTPENYENYYDEIIPNFEERFQKILSLMTPREECVIKKKFVDLMTYEEIGKDFNLTRERIRQILFKAIRKIKSKRNYLTFEKEKLELINKEEIERMREEIKNTLTYEEAKKIVNEFEKYHTINNKEVNIGLADNIEKLDLSVRSFCCLKRSNINCVQDILDYSYDNLMKIRNLGRKSLKEILTKIKEKYGYEYDHQENKFVKNDNLEEY